MKRKQQTPRPKNIAHLFDRLFKLFLSVAEVARDVVRYYTPKSVRQSVDLSYFEQTLSAHISGRFGVSFSDILYQTRLKSGTPARVLFLFEHKSERPDYPVHLQLLDYMLQIWEEDVRRGQSLSLVIAIVLYHGERSWLHKAFLETFENLPNALKPYMPNFRYIAINLSEMSVEDILRRSPVGYLQSLFILLKFARNLSQLGQHLPVIWALLQKRMTDIRALMLRQSTVLYIDNLLKMNKVSVSEWIKQLPPPAQEAYLDLLAEYRRNVISEELAQAEMKGVEQGIQQGIQQGIEIGVEEAKKTFIINLLRAFPDYTDATLAALANASEEWVSQIRRQLAEDSNNSSSDN
jgi:predicted transposase YdaD